MQKNLIYIHCHDLGRFTGAYGRGSTPAIDQFAEDAIVFERAFCASPPCTPSRACALSGRVAHRNGSLGLAHHGWPLPLECDTIVDDFNRGGFTTALCGVNHERHPRTDRYDHDRNQHWDDWQASRAVTNALEFLQQHDAEKSFFLNIGMQEPHRCTWSRFEPKAFESEEWTENYVAEDGSRLDGESFGRFLAAREEMDCAFGTLIEYLDKTGIAENTAIIFTTDHGIFGPRAKGTLYDLGTEIAFILRLPGHSGGRLKPLVSNLDLRPTLLDLFALETPEEALDGLSLVPLLTDSAGSIHQRGAIFTERNFDGEPRSDSCRHNFRGLRSIRTETHHLIGAFRLQDGRADGVPEWELYNCAADPGERENLAGKPESADIEASLREQLLDWMRDTGDFLPEGPLPEQITAPGWGAGWPSISSPPL